MSDRDRKPKLKGDVDLASLDLNPEEGFVLSRIDGNTSVENLAQLTGIAPDKIDSIVEKLESQGAVGGAEHELSEATLHDLTALVDDDLDDDGPPTLAEQAPVGEDASIDSIDALLDEFDDDFDGDVTVDDAKIPAALAAADARAPDAAGDEEPDTDEGEALEPDGTEEEAAADDGTEEEDEEEELDEGNFRKLYAQLFKDMDRDQRVKYAREESGAKLCALCFDPDPGVIRAIFENQKAARQHARLVAEHHRTAMGLTHLAKHNKYLSDSQVQRFLLRNVQTPDPILTRMLQSKALIPLYQVTVSRELADRAKRNARQAFRRKWTSSSADDRVALLFKTEGRCLQGLIGLTIDGRTAQLVCARTIHSVMFIQSLCRFPATPPLILTHLAKSAAVKRAPHIKKLIMQHPNCPSALKRGGAGGRKR